MSLKGSTAFGHTDIETGGFSGITAGIENPLRQESLGTISGVQITDCFSNTVWQCNSFTHWIKIFCSIFYLYGYCFQIHLCFSGDTLVSRASCKSVIRIDS